MSNLQQISYSQNPRTPVGQVASWGRSCALFAACTILAAIGVDSARADVPHIDRVTGDFENGDLITVEGAEFGSHTLEVSAGSGPNGWIESNKVGTDFKRLKDARGWDVGPSSAAHPKISDVQAHSGEKSCYSYVGPVKGGLSWQSVLRYKHRRPFDRLYATWWVYWDAIDYGEFGQWKMWRVNDFGGVSDNCSDVYQTSYWRNDVPTDFQTAIHCNLGCSDWGVCYESVVPDPFYPPRHGQPVTYRYHNRGGSEPFEVNLPAQRQWTRLEIYLDAGDLDEANGSLMLSISKPGEPKKLIDRWTGLMTHKSSCCRDATEPWQWFLLQNLFGDNGGEFDGERADFFFDDIYVQAGTQARVELGDRPIYDDCTKLEIQEPTNWSDESVSLLLNHGSFPAQTEAYLFVVRDDGEVSDGWSLTLP